MLLSCGICKFCVFSKIHHLRWPDRIHVKPIFMRKNVYQTLQFNCTFTTAPHSASAQWQNKPQSGEIFLFRILLWKMNVDKHCVRSYHHHIIIRLIWLLQTILTIEKSISFVMPLKVPWATSKRLHLYEKVSSWFSVGSVLCVCVYVHSLALLIYFAHSRPSFSSFKHSTSNKHPSDFDYSLWRTRKYCC